jgi:hypothetical protein
VALARPGAPAFCQNTGAGPDISLGLPAPAAPGAGHVAWSYPQPGGFYGGWIKPELVGPFKGEPGSEEW